jgi:hypothetical protein
MRSSILFALATVATIAAGAARADRDDPSQYVIQFQGSRTRAEVQAEAATVPATRSLVPAAARVQPALQSGADARALRTQAAEAARRGLIPRGEAG